MNPRLPGGYEVVVVGAGPVGLALANELGSAGVKTLLVEKRPAVSKVPMAVGVTPASLEILRRLGLDEDLVRHGVKVRRAFVTEAGRPMGSLDFTGIRSPYPFMLLVPQPDTMRILARGLDRYPHVEVRYATQYAGVAEHGDRLDVHLRSGAGGDVERVGASWLVGCDGHRSAVRGSAGLKVRRRKYAPRFLMADYDDRTGLGAEAHLYFSPEGSVESFPLPGGRRRWVVLAGAGAQDGPTRHLVDQVRRVSGHRLDTQQPLWESAFRPERMLASRYGRGRMVLCGDAAHVMSPIGGQGMNTGFADAELLAALVAWSRDEPGTWRECLAVYERLRRRAFRVAAARAARGMWLGTRTGLVGSRFRAGLIRQVLLHPRWAPQVAARFAMLTIPYRDRRSVPPRFLTPRRARA